MSEFKENKSMESQTTALNSEKQSKEQENVQVNNETETSVMQDHAGDADGVEYVDYELVDDEHDTLVRYYKHASELAMMFGRQADIVKELPEEPDKLRKMVFTLLCSIAILNGKLSYKLSYRKALSSGCKFALIKGNRHVSSSQVDKLIKDLKDKNVSTFENPIKVVSVRAILEYNKKLDAAQQIHVLDISDVELTPDTPDIDKYVAIIDGQHRYTVCQLHPEYDVDVEFMECHGNVMDSIRTLNTINRNWNNEDRKESNIALGFYKSNMFELSKEIQLLMSVSPKYADFLITFKREAFTKTDLVNAIDNSNFTDEKGERGKLLMGAILHSFKDHKKEYRRIQLIDAINSTYEKSGEANKPRFARDMACCLVNLSKEQVGQIVNCLSNNDFGTLNTFMKSVYESYSISHIEVMDKEFEKAKLLIQKAIEDAKNDAANKNNRKIKNGTPSEIINNRKVENAKKSSAS